VNCPAVRDRLPEHALGIVDHHDATAIERHLAWCAACRKEARDLERSAATMAFALAPAHPAPELGERVIDAVRRVSAPAQPTRPARSRGRRVGVVLLAAALTVAGLGAGAVLGRHEGPPPPPASRGEQQAETLAKFQAAIQHELDVVGGANPNITAQIGTLAATQGVQGSGAALTLSLPQSTGQVFVWVSGLSAKHLPYRAFIADGKGHVIEVARIKRLDKDGGAMVPSTESRNIARFDRVFVRDPRGHVVLSGSLSAAPASA